MTGLARCANCVLPSTLPSVTLDSNGVCNYCRSYHGVLTEIDAAANNKKAKLEALIGRLKRLGRPYDCLITLSGGKDSTYALYIAAKHYGLKCLCVTFDNGYMSSFAKSNIKNAVELAGADHLFYTVNRRLLNDLYKLFLVKAGDFCSVCMRGIEQCQHIVSENYGIPMVISGGGSRVAYLDIPEVFQGGDPTFFKNVAAGTDLEKQAGSMLPPENTWSSDQLLRLTNRVSRKILGKEVIKTPVAQPVYLIHIFDYFAPSPDEVIDTLQREMGWRGPEGQVEHMDCKLHGIAAFIRELKFPDVTETSFYHSGLIRRCLMTRADALRTEEEKLASRETPEELGHFLKEIGMSSEEFHDAVHDWRKVEKYRSNKPQLSFHSILERVKNA